MPAGSWLQILNWQLVCSSTSRSRRHMWTYRRSHISLVRCLVRGTAFPFTSHRTSNLLMLPSPTGGGPPDQLVELPHVHAPVVGLPHEVTLVAGVDLGRLGGRLVVDPMAGLAQPLQHPGIEDRD